jgi:predicted TIM-barrel fold metal-dependent hydrolase
MLYKFLFVLLILGCIIIGGNLLIKDDPTGYDSEKYYTFEDFKSVPKFDSHVHINTRETAYMEQAQKDNFRFLKLVDDRPFGLPMKDQQEIAIYHLREYSELMTFATTFSVDGWDDPNWVEKTIADLKSSISKGARAVKIWKNVGMDLRDKKDEFVMVNDSKLDVIMDFLSENEIPVIGHNGEPRDCWLPLDEMTFSQGYYSSHPEYHMFLHPEYPSYEDQINARDNMLAKHPDLKFVGAHLGSLEWNLEELSKRLNKYPNMHVDLSRMSNLKLHTLRDRQKTRDFFIKYQDRLLYATDTSIGESMDSADLQKKIHTGWKNDWRFYTTDDKMTLGNFGEFRGLKLPREVIDKIYLKNALRILGIF